MSVRPIELTEDVLISITEGSYLDNEAGAVVWDAALCLIGYISKHSHLIQNRRVIDVGTGTGAVGIAAAALGARSVTFTDLEHLLPLIDSNVEANRHLYKEDVEIKVCLLPWGEPVHSALGGLPENCPIPYDLVLASDVVYESEAIPLLINTLKSLCESGSKNTLLLISNEHRAKLPFPVDTFGRQGFKVTHVPYQDLHPQWRSPDIQYYSTSAPPAPPEQQRDTLQAQATELRNNHAILSQKLAQATGQAAAQLNPPALSVMLPVPPESPQAKVEELVALQSAQHYLQYLQELQALSRHTEKVARTAERAFNSHPDGNISAEAFQEVSEAVNAFSNTMGYVIALHQLSESGNLGHSSLQQFGNATIQRVISTGNALRELLSATIQGILTKRCNWPPPIIVSASIDASAAAAAAEWNGFELAGEGVLEQLQHLLVIDLTLQRAIEYQAFSRLASTNEGSDVDLNNLPVLWPAVELSNGIAQWLRHHFASGLPTDRPDRPEWLFAAALKATRQCAVYGEIFQPCVDAHGLQEYYSMQLEVAKAIGSSAVGDILKSHVLPRFVGLDNQPSWLHYVDEAIRYEKSLAPLRGVVIGIEGEIGADGVGTTIALYASPASAIEVLFETSEWRDGWLNAEKEDIERQVDAAIEAIDAWKPAVEASMSAVLGLAGASLDEVASPSPLDTTATIASQHEFYPPVCAETLLTLVTLLIERGGCVFDPRNARLYYQSTVQAALKTFRSRLSSMLTRAEQFDHLLDTKGLPKVAAAICATHFVEHSLREPEGPLLLAIADNEPLAALLEREAGALSTFRRQWAYTLAKSAVERFQKTFSKYKRDLHHFRTMDFDPSLPLPGPSARLLPAAETLQTLLKMMAIHLDAVVFRDVWKAMALAVNYAFFNNVETEGTFSAGGARQLEADLQAVIAVFGTCTSRPAAHFKEAREGCRLLGMEKKEATLIWEGVHGGGTRYAAGMAAVLETARITSLNAEQVVSVLSHRADGVAQ